MIKRACKLAGPFFIVDRDEEQAGLQKTLLHLSRVNAEGDCANHLAAVLYGD